MKILSFKTCLPALAILFSLAGCSAPAPRPLGDTGLADLKPARHLEQEKSVSDPGPPPIRETLRPVPGSAQKPHLYSLSFKNASLAKVIDALLDQTDLSLSAAQDVDMEREITVQLRNNTLEEALDVVIKRGAGYAWKLERGRLEITALEERIYVLNYLNLTKDLDIKVGGDMLASSVDNAGVEGKFGISVKQSTEQSDIWSQIGEVLEGIKSSGGCKDSGAAAPAEAAAPAAQTSGPSIPGLPMETLGGGGRPLGALTAAKAEKGVCGILQLNPMSGLIYMADTPQKIQAMVRYLDQLTEALSRQVFIEAKIVEVRLNDNFRNGIDWSRVGLALNPNSFSGAPDLVNFSFNGGGSIVLNEVTRLDAILDHLRTQGDISVLSNPHLTVMNGQSAVMTVGSQFPFSDITGVSRDEETNVVTIDATIRRVVFGLQLGISTQISKEGIITLHVVPTITRQDGTQTVTIPVSAAATASFDNPVIGLQELATTVRVRDGQPVILGGLISKEETRNKGELPGLASMPIFGKLFRNQNNSSQTRELVILLKPYIKEVI